MPTPRSRRRRWPWIVGAIIVVLLIPIAIVVVPILTHQSGGLSHQDEAAVEWPLQVSATGDDGRTRELSVVASDPDGSLDTSGLVAGERLIVSGSGFDAGQGIYVAICVIPASPDIKPGPCIGGVPDQEQEQVAEGTIQYAPSNWINDDWAWKLFGSRSYDDREAGTFTAYIEVGEPVADGIDCRTSKCGIFTRNDHTALTDRVQDLYIPVGFK